MAWEHIIYNAQPVQSMGVRLYDYLITTRPPWRYLLMIDNSEIHRTSCSV